MALGGIRPWFEKQLEPLAAQSASLHPDLFTGGALVTALAAAALLYGAYEHPWMAAAAVPFLLVRLAITLIRDTSQAATGAKGRAAEVINELTDRLCDIAIFLPLAFWPDAKTLLVLLGLIAMLMVSYAGVLGKAAGVQRIREGILGNADRMVLLMVACLVDGVVPNLSVMGYSVFEAMFALFIPLASFTLLQRLDRIFYLLSKNDEEPKN